MFQNAVTKLRGDFCQQVPKSRNSSSTRVKTCILGTKAYMLVSGSHFKAKEQMLASAKERVPVSSLYCMCGVFCACTGSRLVVLGQEYMCLF